MPIKYKVIVTNTLHLAAIFVLHIYEPGVFLVLKTYLFLQNSTKL